MKIAMIGHKRIPSREGGIEIVVEELSTRMVQKGHQVDVYNRKGKHVAGSEFNMKKIKEYNGVRIITIPTFEKKSLNAIVYSFFATIRALFGKYDVIHYHAEGPCVMLPIAHFFGKRCVATIHGLDWQRSKWGGFATKILLHGEKMAAKYADEVIVLSENVKKYFKDTYNRDVVYLVNGVNIPDILPDDIISKKFGVKEGEYILFLARIVPEKGLHYLINAFMATDTDKKLIIAGSPSHSKDYYDEMRELASKDDRIKFIGFVQGDELKQLFSNCFLYVMPSDVEGMPISLLEALSYGRRCLVSDIPENVEATKEYAVTFKHSDVEDLKKMLAQCLKEEYVFHKECVNFVREKYYWDTIADATLELYSGEY